MEKLLYIMLIWVVSTTSIYSQTVAGKIVDESNLRRKVLDDGSVQLHR